MTQPIRPRGYREQNREVFYLNDPIVTAGPEDIAFLKCQAAANPRKRSRLCAHPDIKAGVHEMLIVHHRDVFVRPHYHIGKSESFLVIEGAATVLFFEESGSLLRAIRVGAAGSGLPFYYRIPERMIHALIIEAEWLVFQEVTQGPFDSVTNVTPPWSPDDQDPEQCRAFLAELGPLIEAQRDSSR